MSKVLIGRINLNTVLTTIVGALVVFGITKADKAFTTITRLEDRQEDMSHRLERIEGALGFISPLNKGKSQ